MAELIGVWDGARLTRVVDNLLSNAVKYSPDGGETTVHVGRVCYHGEAYAVLTVQDRGIGIPAVDLPYTFERFHRAANVRGIAGNGIGLAGARQIIEQHGGQISVESVEGEGSTFTVRLPLTPPRDPDHT
ncbi:MAG: sensor histidine kinase [Dehalococcoidia bacterium]